MTLRDVEVIELLADEPELLAIADAVSATQRKAAAPQRRRFVVRGGSSWRLPLPQSSRCLQRRRVTPAACSAVARAMPGRRPHSHGGGDRERADHARRQGGPSRHQLRRREDGEAHPGGLDRGAVDEPARLSASSRRARERPRGRGSAPRRPRRGRLPRTPESCFPRPLDGLSRSSGEQVRTRRARRPRHRR